MTTKRAGDSLADHDEEFDRLVRQEELILDVTEMLVQALDDADVTRTELARRLGRTPGYVSQVFGGGKNLTLRTVSDIAFALSLRPAFKLSPDHDFVLEFRQWTGETRRWKPPTSEPVHPSSALPSSKAAA